MQLLAVMCGRPLDVEGPVLRIVDDHQTTFRAFTRDERQAREWCRSNASGYTLQVACVLRRTMCLLVAHGVGHDGWRHFMHDGHCRAFQTRQSLALLRRRERMKDANEPEFIVRNICN